MEQTKFDDFTIEQLLDFLHSHKVAVYIARYKEAEDDYEVTMTFDYQGLNDNKINCTLVGRGKDLKYVIHGILKDFLRLK